MAECLSVCPSQAAVLSKWLNGSCTALADHGGTFWLGLSYKLLNGYLNKGSLWQFVQKSRFRRKILLQPVNHQVLSTQFDRRPLPDYYTEHLLLSATGCMWYGASQGLSALAETCSLNWSCTICSRPLLELVTFACVWFQTAEAV